MSLIVNEGFFSQHYVMLLVIVLIVIYQQNFALNSGDSEMLEDAELSQEEELEPLEVCCYLNSVIFIFSL